MTILFTRSIDETSKTRLTAVGIDVSECNVLTIHTLPSAAEDILNTFTDFKNLVFTSQHAARIFFDILAKNQILLPPSVSLFSTAGETKKVIEKYFYSPTLSAPAAEPLAHLMLEKAHLSEGVHFIGGTLSLPILTDILTQNHVALTKIVVYETLIAPIPQHKLNKADDGTATPSFDAVVFFSLSAADAFLMHNDLQNPTLVFTLGTTTAEYVRNKTGINAIFTADTPSIESLVDMVIRVMHNTEYSDRKFHWNNSNKPVRIHTFVETIQKFLASAADLHMIEPHVMYQEAQKSL